MTLSRYIKKGKMSKTSKPSLYYTETKRHVLQTQMDDIILSVRHQNEDPSQILKVWDLVAEISIMASNNGETYYQYYCYDENIKWLQLTYEARIKGLPLFAPDKIMKKELAVIKNVYGMLIHKNKVQYNEDTILADYNRYLTVYIKFIFLREKFETCLDISNTIGRIMLKLLSV